MEIKRIADSSGMTQHALMTAPSHTSASLPQPSPEALAHSRRLAEQIREVIAKAGGWLPFSEYMELALYAPGLGYYSAGARKLGADGDFTTAPEMSPLFGQVLARQVQQIFEQVPSIVLEVGAGSGALAASLLAELEKLGALPDQYWILELSADLRQRERDTLAERVPHLMERVAWLNQLPPSFSGVILGNEVLDAMPVEVFRIGEAGVEQAGVTGHRTEFEWAWRPAGAVLAEQIEALDLAPGYRSEIAPAAAAFIASLGARLEKAAAIFIDYGFPQREYYHPQRSAGTLMCHYRHHAHDDPFFLPGLQDITAHVDFSAMARAAHGAGLEVLGYANQAQFLINCGITDILSGSSQEDTLRYLATASAAQKLLSPAEMGELFKVIAFGRGVQGPLLGFRSGDKTETL
jgi:SAM-dependent MidA family methyltransferase